MDRAGNRGGCHPDRHSSRAPSQRLRGSTGGLPVRLLLGLSAAFAHVQPGLAEGAASPTQAGIAEAFYYFAGAPVGLVELESTATLPSRHGPFSTAAPSGVRSRVYRHSRTGGWLITYDEIVVRLYPDRSIDDVVGPNLHLVRKIRGSQREYLVRIDSETTGSVIDVANGLVDSQRVLWAEPNFHQVPRRDAIPDDAEFGSQWGMHNTGTGSAVAGADVGAVEAWDIELGHPEVTIAIVDDGVESTHEDLAANIYVNPGEIADNGLDDDGNGFIDDVHGWDFLDNDNDPGPSDPDDNHGTAVAGIAAAAGFNSQGIAGMCPACSILPVKIFSGNATVDNATIAEALRYAGALAGVVNGSWELNGASNVIESAIDDISTTSRGGLGSLVVFSAGNSEVRHELETANFLPAGTHRFILEYIKDFAGQDGEDAAWISRVRLPDGTVVDFEGGLPSGWTSSGDAPWTVVTDPVRALEEHCLTRALKSGQISDGQASRLEFLASVPVDESPFGSLDVLVSTSSESFDDKFRIRVDLDDDGSIDQTSFGASGTTDSSIDLAFPASAPGSVAVGASSDNDCRSGYSRFGPVLDFLAPSSGSLLSRTLPRSSEVETTDRTGSPGFAEGSYHSGFGGTSAAAPIASGIAALLLSRAPQLSAAELRQIMRNTSEKVGIEAYVNGRNDRYGFGRINAASALGATTAARTSFNLTIHRNNPLGGSVRSDVAGIDCGENCSANYPGGTTVTLTTSTAADTVFEAFRGGDDDCNDGIVTLTRNLICTAVFDSPRTRESNPGGGGLALSTGLWLVAIPILVFALWRRARCRAR